MNTATSYYRVPAVIFAVLIGGLFVYAKSGGRFFAPARSTPAAGTVENDPSLPRIEFMMGPKSAPAFLPEDSVQVQSATSQQQAEPVTRSTLLPGSKSAVVVAPESLVPANAPPPQPPGQNTVQPTRPRLLPGSKSIILVDPSTLQSPPPVIQQQAQPAPQRPRTNAQGVER